MENHRKFLQSHCFLCGSFRKRDPRRGSFVALSSCRYSTTVQKIVEEFLKSAQEADFEVPEDDGRNPQQICISCHNKLRNLALGAQSSSTMVLTEWPIHSASCGLCSYHNCRGGKHPSIGWPGQKTKELTLYSEVTEEFSDSPNLAIFRKYCNEAEQKKSQKDWKQSKNFDA